MHTPGEWTVQQATDAAWEVNAAETSDGKWSAVVLVQANEEGSRKVTPEEAEANALLIGAAPDLLAACEALLTAQSSRRHPLGAPDEGISSLCAEAASKARLAIAKSKPEGVTPCSPE